MKPSTVNNLDPGLARCTQMHAKMEQIPRKKHTAAHAKRAHRKAGTPAKPPKSREEEHAQNATARRAKSKQRQDQLMHARSELPRGLQGNHSVNFRIDALRANDKLAASGAGVALAS